MLVDNLSCDFPSFLKIDLAHGSDVCIQNQQGGIFQALAASTTSASLIANLSLTLTLLSSSPKDLLSRDDTEPTPRALFPLPDP